MVERDAQATNAAGADTPNLGVLTFSQAQGYDPLPQPLALEDVSHEARVRLWSLLHQHAVEEHSHWLSYAWQGILEKVHVEFFEQPVDTYVATPKYLIRVYKPFFLNRDQQNDWITPFNQIFDLLQKLMRIRGEHDQYFFHPLGDFVREIRIIFKECRLAYTVSMRQPLTILPAVTEQEGQALLSAMDQLRTAGFGEASECLRKAGERINEGLWADSIHESINAIESVARQIAPGTPQALGAALNTLGKQGMIPSALKSTLDNLNRYANEPGIRHAPIDQQRARADQDEAVLMLGVCASFASYIWRKHQAG